MNPTISIITPCYNAARFVGRTIESVRAQSLESWEHIIVDDGSTDESAAVVAEYAKSDSRIRLLRKPNGGVASARNFGFKDCSASSKYLLFLDADDCLEPQMLEEMGGYLGANGDVGMVYCKAIYIDENDQMMDPERGNYFISRRFAPTRFGVRSLPDDVRQTPFETIFSSTAWIIPSIAVIRRSVYLTCPGWDEDFGQLCEDFDLFLQIAIRSRVDLLPKNLVRYRRHTEQCTAGHTRYQAQEKKLYDKWRDPKGLTEQQRSVVRDAFAFLEGRVAPYQGALAGIRCLQRAEWARAFQFLGGATRRYAASFV